jgi:hypothetical protein
MRDKREINGVVFVAVADRCLLSIDNLAELQAMELPAAAYWDLSSPCRTGAMATC